MVAEPFLQSVYLLHRRPYSGSSLLIELLGREAGRFPAIAKGARAARDARAGLLQPFIPLLVSWSGRGEVKTLRRVESERLAPRLVGRSLYCGFYLNELLMRLVGRQDACPGLFDAYAAALTGLSGGQGVERVLRRFELRLLEELGYGLVLTREAETDAPVTAERWYQYRVELGPVATSGEPSHDAVSGWTLLGLAGQGPLDERALREARGLMRRVLGHYLGERPLKSRELFATHS
jgi:DNA repair protein RecO (recombination protein O)